MKKTMPQFDDFFSFFLNFFYNRFHRIIKNCALIPCVHDSKKQKFYFPKFCEKFFRGKKFLSHIKSFRKLRPKFDLNT